MQFRLPLGMFALHSSPRAGWSGGKFRKFWAVGGKPFTERAETPPWRGIPVRLAQPHFGAVLQVCGVSFRPEAQGCS